MNTITITEIRTLLNAMTIINDTPLFSCGNAETTETALTIKAMATDTSKSEIVRTYADWFYTGYAEMKKNTKALKLEKAWKNRNFLKNLKFDLLVEMTG